MPNASPEIIANPERLASLLRLCLLDTPADPAFDRLTQLAARIINAPISTVTLVDDHRQYLKSQVGVGDPWATLRSMPLEYSYCQHVVASQSPLIVEDSRVHPLLFDNLSTLQEGLVAYAGIPLVTSDGDAIGSFCVIDKKERIWSDEEISVLTELSQLVMTEIELRAEIITRQEVADALRKSEQRLQAVITGAPVIVYVVDTDGVIQMTEGRGLEAVGSMPNRHVGKSSYEVYQDHPEIVEGIRRGLTGSTSSIITQQQTQIGPVHYELRISPLHNSDMQIVGAIGVATDVTERIIAEQALEKTIQRLTFLRRVDVELSESLDLDSVLTIAMDTALRASSAQHGFIGLLEGDQLRAVHTAGNYKQDSLFDLSEGVVGRALRMQKPQLVLDVTTDQDYVADLPATRAQMTIPLIHRDHLVGVLNLETSKPEKFTREAFDFLGMIASHLTVAIDNSQLYKVSQQQLEELHQLYMRVSDLEQLKTDMIRIAAHDLRNPIGIVKGYTALMMEDGANLTEEQHDFLNSIENSSEKMLKIIGDILSLQRIEAMQNKVNCDEADLNELVGKLAHECRPQAERKKQQFTITLSDVPAPICVDLSQVREAIDNIIGNAIKYTPDGGSVTVTMRVEDKHGIFEVKDTGYGVAPDEQARLFQPFFRASNARESSIEGTGLGLHLVKKIIERHGGTMRFESALGEGSTFGFELPLEG